MSSPKALLLLADGFEELETIAPIDILRRAGVEVHIASVSGAPSAKGRSGVTIHADAQLPTPETLPGSFTMLVLPGGPGVLALRKNRAVLEIIQKFHAAKLPIGAICAAPLLLKDADVLGDHLHTSHDSVWGELPNSIGTERVVLSDNIITSRGAGTAIDFALALAATATSLATAARVRTEIMA